MRFYHNIYTDTNKWIFLLFYKNEVCMGARTILDDLHVKKSNNSVHGYSCTTDLLATSRSITITGTNCNHGGTKRRGFRPKIQYAWSNCTH